MFKKPLAALVLFSCLLVGFAIGVGTRSVRCTVNLARALGPASENGDVNGDGELDLSDAIFLLLHLFQGGPSPVACAAGEDFLSRLGDLEGRVEALERERECSPENRSPDRFVDNSDGTLFDPCSGLTWTTAHLDLNGDGTIGPEDVKTWEGARAACQALVFGGHDDWRLPTIHEFGSLRHCVGCSAVQEWIRDTPFVWPIFNAWSDSTSSHDPARAWAFNLTETADQPNFLWDKATLIRVLAVRGP